MNEFVSSTDEKFRPTGNKTLTSFGCFFDFHEIVGTSLITTDT